VDLATTADDIEFVVNQLRSSPLSQTVAELAALTIERLAKRPPLRVGIPIVVDLNHNIATRGADNVHLTPICASMLYQLAHDYPKVVSVPDLLRAAYGKRPPNSPNTVRVMISDLRKVIAPLKANIHNRHGWGYRLDLEPRE
jgi:DNA-binding response OmpR family regulator